MSERSPTSIISLLRRTFAILSNTDDSVNLDERNGWINLKEHPEPPSYDDYDPFKPVEISGRLLSTTKLVHSLLVHSFDVHVVGKSLWDSLVASPNWDKRGNAPGRMIRTVTQGDWYTKRVALIDGYRLSQLAAEIAACRELRKVVHNWANKYWRNLLIPFFECATISLCIPTDKSPSSSDSVPLFHSDLESPTSLREQLLLRDGATTVVGLVTDERAPATYRIHPSAGGFGPLLPAHIIPFNAYKNQNLLEMLRHYSGDRIPQKLLTQAGITLDPQNAFLLDHNSRKAFSEFLWSVDFTPTGYRMKYFTPYLPSRYELLHPDGSSLHFGKGVDGGRNISLPSTLLCQLHASLGKVLHACGAADVINQVMKEELAIKEAGADGMNWGPTGESYLMRKLEEAAFRQEPGVYDDDDDSGNDG